MRKGDWVQTYSGRQFWPLDPRQDEVEIEDIAHSLSMQCRYNGHSLRFYSVAEHSWRLSFLVPKEFALEALLHDAAEAYICDIPRPLKPFLTGYAAIEEGVERVIAARFSLVYPWPQEVKDADARILVDEKEWLMSASPAEWDLPLPGFDIGVTLLRPLWPEAAKSAFLIRYHQLKGGVS